MKAEDLSAFARWSTFRHSTQTHGTPSSSLAAQSLRRFNIHGAKRSDELRRKLCKGLKGKETCRLLNIGCRRSQRRSEHRYSGSLQCVSPQYKHQPLRNLSHHRKKKAISPLKAFHGPCWEGQLPSCDVRDQTIEIA